MTEKSIPGTVEAWESGALGTSEAHVRRASAKTKGEIGEALGLQAISIRLPKATIQAYKDLAEMHGVGYQPLMREAICRWPEGELKQLLAGAIESQRTWAKRERTTAHQTRPQKPLKKAA
jgi:hypothetical protein